MYALDCLYEEELRKRMTETYIAEHLWFATGALYAIGGSDLQTPRYTDLITTGAVDNRTSEQIKADILKKLTQ